MLAQTIRPARFLGGRRAVVVATALAVAVAPLALSTPAQGFDVVQDRIVNDNPADFTPRVLDDPGSVRYFAQAGNTIVAGGNFTKVAEAGSNTVIPRTYAFAFDAATGQVDPNFAPQIDGIVYSVVTAPGGDAVFLGGEFKTVNGAQRISLAKVSLATGQLDPTFNAPRLNGRVFTMKLANNKLYVGGTFTKVGVNDITAITAFNPVTGAVDLTTDVPFAGTHNGGVTLVMKMDISPDGSRLAAVGNFTTVGGLDREQAVLLNLDGPAAVVSGWQTNRYKSQCGTPTYQSYMHDVQFAPDGAYFVIVTTGSYDPVSLCDSAARWETSGIGVAQEPTWANLSGGDTLWSVAITGPVVYVGGHFRWLNNHFAHDKQGPGAVPRPGIAALDPLTGVPFDWNPGRTTGVGVFDMFATSAGLWVGHDTDLIGKEIHPKLAFFPIAGGKVVPNPSRGQLPGDLLQFGQAATTNTQVLHRVNAGGPQVAATDGGPAWARDTNFLPSARHNSGSTAKDWGSAVGAISASVPSTTPTAVFTDDRFDPAAAPEMAWNFPVASGTPVEVRLYFANRDPNTANPGQRLFDIVLDGKTVTERYDLLKALGHNVAGMRSYSTVSDGTVNIDFVHRINNPAISAVEIIRTCGDRATTGTNDRVFKRTFNGTNAGPATAVPSSGTAWSQARGAFMISGTVYAGFSDGSLCARSFNGTSFGPPRPIELYQSNHIRTSRTLSTGDLPNVTAMFFNNNRLYYTVAGKPSLFYRYFSPQSEILGAQQLRATFSGGNIEFENVRGMVLSEDPEGSEATYLYFTMNTGVLKRIRWNGTATVPFTDQTISGPGIDGIDWRQQGLALFVPPGA